MNDRDALAVVSCVRGGLALLLPSRGFVRVEERQARSGHLFDRWVRRSAPWKEEWVDLSHRMGFPESLVANVSLSVVLPDRAVPVDGVNVPYLAGREGLLHRSWRDRLHPLRPSGWLCTRAVQDVEAALGWFDRYATAQQVLAALPSAQRNGVGVGTAVHAEVAAFVRGQLERGQVTSPP